jgi:predicted DNA-binding transcriptional regulator YafY
MHTRTIVSIRDREPFGEPVSNSGRVERTLKLIKFLREWRTIKECAEHIKVTTRSIQRYFQLLMNLGFRLQYNSGCFYAFRICNIDEYFT